MNDPNDEGVEGGGNEPDLTQQAQAPPPPPPRHGGHHKGKSKHGGGSSHSSTHHSSGGSAKKPSSASSSSHHHHNNDKPLPQPPGATPPASTPPPVPPAREVVAVVDDGGEQEEEVENPEGEQELQEEEAEPEPEEADEEKEETAEGEPEGLVSNPSDPNMVAPTATATATATGSAPKAHHSSSRHHGDKKAKGSDKSADKKDTAKKSSSKKDGSTRKGADKKDGTGDKKDGTVDKKEGDKKEGHSSAHHSSHHKEKAKEKTSADPTNAGALPTGSLSTKADSSTGEVKPHKTTHHHDHGTAHDHGPSHGHHSSAAKSSAASPGNPLPATPPRLPTVPCTNPDEAADEETKIEAQDEQPGSENEDHTTPVVDTQTAVDSDNEPDAPDYDAPTFPDDEDTPDKEEPTASPAQVTPVSGIPFSTMPTTTSKPAGKDELPEGFKFCGWLKKQASTGGFWQKRWFVLKDFTKECILQYFKSKTDKEAAYEIDLAQYSTAVKATDGGKQHCFKIFNANDLSMRPYFLLAENEDQLNKWLSQLKEVFDSDIHKKLHVKFQHMRGNVAIDGPMEGSNTGNDKEFLVSGWLIKLGGAKGGAKNWKKRWFCNTAEDLFTLSYHTSPNATKKTLKGTIDLREVEGQVQVAKNPGKINLTLVTPTREWTMVAEGETSIEYWPPKLNRLLDLLKERRGVAITSTKPSGFPTGSPIATVPLYTSPVVTTTTALPTSPLTTKSPATSAPPSSTPASIANDGWKECVDATTGRKYYWNKLTRVTQWHPPPCFAKPGEVAEEEKSDSASGTESDSGDDNCDESTPLAPGWKEVCDSTGRKYYYNPSTKVTQWKRPTAS